MTLSGGSLERCSRSHSRQCDKPADHFAMNHKEKLEQIGLVLVGVKIMQAIEQAWEEAEAERRAVNARRKQVTLSRYLDRAELKRQIVLHSVGRN